MRRYMAAISVAALLTGVASAQSPQSGSHNPATKDGSPHTVSAPADGANSFTEDQAHGRLAKAGYTKIGKLTKNDGLWTTTAVKGGKSHKVALDYKGNITVR
ncbi:hypothetical protein LWE61_19480 [Sphingobium sufflavum]|uniref:hypothetical protein n=1 Tax=Sphingobium sufflavum TaxID=1129547 RepID=UPI001F39DD5C|nr:hypothetical protein [Sphingobium sufflavum]MCE7798715.1 hypothetical protein [Sphingobium sufflavum]